MERLLIIGGLFVLARLCKIGGGYLTREGRSAARFLRNHSTNPKRSQARPGSKKAGPRKMVENPPKTSTGASHTGTTLARTRSMLKTIRPMVKTRVERG